jgi:uncharacterized metal-binding protein
MSIEQDLNRIANSLETLTSFLCQGAPTTAGCPTAVVQEAPKRKAKATADVAGAASEEATPPAPTATEAAVRDSLKELCVKTGSAETAQAILAKFGATKIRDIKEENYAEVLEKVAEALKTNGKKSK